MHAITKAKALLCVSIQLTGSLVDDYLHCWIQCQTIISAEDGAEELMKIIIEDPVSTLDSFAYLVTVLETDSSKN